MEWIFLWEHDAEAASDPSAQVSAVVLGDAVVQGGRPGVELGDHAVRRQPAVAPPEALHADVGDLPEHVVLLDERLLHELPERHPLQCEPHVCSLQKKLRRYARSFGEPTLGKRSVCIYLCCLNFRLVDLDFVG